MPELNASQWDEFLSQYPNTHLLQTTAWGELKAEFDWQVLRVISPSLPPQSTSLGDSMNPTGAQVLFRRLPLGLNFAYIPRGPVAAQESPQPLKDLGSLWSEVDRACRKRRCVFLKVEPDLWKGAGSEPIPSGFITSPHTIQPPHTILLDLNGTEEEILGRMKQKTRYNIRLALKKGVVIRPSEDVGLFFRIMEDTGERNRFGVHSQAYYQRSYDLFHAKSECELLLAELEGEPLAALMVFTHGTRAWYFYGASGNTHREAMPTYLLQWEAIRWARHQGCTQYDLWGIPDACEEELEENFTQRSDGLWGVYRFKRGFGGELRRSAGPWDRIYQPFLYKLYRIFTKIDR